MVKSLQQSSDRGSELFFEKVLSQLEDFISISNRQNQFVYANDKLERLWKLTREGYMWKKPTQMRFSKENALMLERGVNEVFQTGKPKSGAFTYTNPEKTACHYEYILNPILDQHGHVEFVACVSRDVTERSRIEEALQESERQFKVLFESIDQAFCLLEVLYDEEQQPVDFRLLKANPAFVRQTGVSEESIGKKQSEVMPELETHWVEAWCRVATSGQPEHLLEDSPAMGRWYDSNIIPIDGPGGRRIALLFYDITTYINLY